MTALKKFLLGLMLFGAVTYFGGGGTFASFSAETSNNGSSVASGTLTMSATVTGGTQGTCLSAGGSALNNVNPACDKVFSLTNVAPGVFGGLAKITVANTGSIDASKFSLWASPPNAVLSGSPVLNGSGNVVSLPISALEGNIASGDQVTVSYGTHTQLFTAAATAAGATSIVVTGTPAPNFTYLSGATVVDTSPITANNLDCYDTKIAAASTFNFNPVAGNPLCGAMQIFVQERTAGLNYCWLGKGSGSSPQASGGVCVAPVSVTLATALTTAVNGTTSLSVAGASGLNGNVASGDHIVVSSGSNTQTFIASAPAYIGASSISVNAATANFAYPIGSTVTDKDSLDNLNAGVNTLTLTNFDSVNGALGTKVFMPPLTGNGAADGNAPVQLGRAGSSSPTDTRTFYVGVYLPSNGVQNQLQGLSSTFGITWHLDQ
jgi:hypothetical protein